LDNFKYHEISAESLQEPNPHRVLAQITADHLDMTQFDVYVSGPTLFVEKAQEALLQRGVAPAQLSSVVT